MAAIPSKRTRTSYSTASTTYKMGAPPSGYESTSYPLYGTGGYATTTSRPRTGRRSTGRPSTARPRTGLSTLGVENQEIICAVSESRGISPTVGLAFVNLDTGEAVLSQISDSQTYVRTVHKLIVFNPSNILLVSTAANPRSKLFSIIHDSLDDIDSVITLLDRRYWAEATGIEYIQQLAFADDLESIKTAVSGNYYAVCCFAAALRYVELRLAKTFPARSLRMKYEPPEGSMMIDLSSIRSLELVQNLHQAKSRDCLFGLLNETLTPMGGRLLRSNILQPLTDADTLNRRYDAVEEMSTKEQMFFSVRDALKPVLDADKMLTQLILTPAQPSLKDTEQAINNVILLKQFVMLIQPVFEALTGSRCSLLQEIREMCTSANLEPILALINGTINEDTAYAKQPLDLRNQRTYAVKSGVNGLLDVARQTYKEAMTDALQHMTDTIEHHGLPLQVKFDNTRHFYMRMPAGELEQRNLPVVFINVFRKKDMIECQTLELIKRNQKIVDSYSEVVMMSDQSVQDLITNARPHMSILFKICEGLAMLDMLLAFAQLVTSQEYVRPIISDTLAIRAGRHPIREKIHKTKFVPNDVYATQQNRFQIVTGANMSGKSTYIRSVALMSVMAQIGCFVPAQYAAIPMMRQLFARVSIDDNIEANVSTFAAEMREMAFILRNIDDDQRSIIIVDELGRGTGSADGLAIALAIAEALIEARVFVWFATHFHDLAHILSERNGVTNLHLAADLSQYDRIEMSYRIASGAVKERHYGLKLAKLLPLPNDLLDRADHIAATLERQNKAKGNVSSALVTAKRRRLLLNLKEHLAQARGGTARDAELLVWLKQLQLEFVEAMTRLDEQMRHVELGGQQETMTEVEDGNLDNVRQTIEGDHDHSRLEQQSML